MHPKSVIDNQIKIFLHKQFAVGNGKTSKKQKNCIIAYHILKNFLVRHICERLCKDIDINIAFLSLKLSSFFSVKDTLSKSIQSYVFYQFPWAGCKACYTGETKRDLNTRTEKHLGKDKKSHVYSHLQENPQCQEKVNFDCFKLKIKETMHINWKKPELNKQVKHVKCL